MKAWKDTTAREMLEILEHWAQVQHEKEEYSFEPHRLWNVLTALRGPDSGDNNLKYDTTAIIRYLTVPTLAGDGSIVREGSVKDIDTKFNSAEEHFSTHIQIAAIALKEMGYK